MNKTYGVIGAGGCGRGIMPIVKQNFQNHKDTIIYFVDDFVKDKLINGIEVISTNDFINLEDTELKAMIAIADTRLRFKKQNEIKNKKIDFINLISNKSIIMDDVKMGEGCLISPFVTFTSNIEIGNFFHANLYSYIEHDCIIGDYVTFAPGVKCNGNVLIEDHTYIGSGATIINGNNKRKIKIGSGAIVGAGAVVIEDVKPYSTVVGVPAREVDNSN